MTVDPKREFFDEQERRVRQYLRRQLPDPQAIEDVAQETWRAFFAKWFQESVLVEPERYLFVIAHHRARNWWRGHGRRAEDVTDFADPDPAIARALLRSGPDPDENVVSRLDLAKAISRLPARQREALLLRYQDGLAMKQVAALMGISVSGADKAVHAALEALRRSPLLAGYLSSEAPR